MSVSPALATRPARINALNMIALGLLFSIFLLPGFEFYSGAPQVRPDDMFAYLMLLTLLISYPWRFSIQLREYMFFLAALTLWILVTQLGNDRLFVISDYFEYYKMLKFIIVLMFFYITFRHNSFFTGNGYYFLRVLFCGVVIFNLLHYFGLLSFNQVVMPYYAGEHQLSRFGLSSQGLPDVKRLLGVMGNPNDNAIIMGFFSIVFINQFTQNKEGRLLNGALALAALVLLLMGGSRTAFVAIIFVFALYWFVAKTSFKALLGVILFGAAFFGLVHILDITYISNLWTVNLLSNASLMERIEIWDALWKMILQSPWIGYGPNKEYFYANNLFAESDYVLMTWRYGFPGTVMYLLWLGIPALLALRHRELIAARTVILFSAFLYISALTNVPLQEPRINILFAALCGILYADLARKREEQKGSRP